jgi:hypothetical protein
MTRLIQHRTEDADKEQDRRTVGVHTTPNRERTGMLKVVIRQLYYTRFDSRD